MKRYKREYQQPIKLKVINLIKHWIDGYYDEDLACDDELAHILNEFIEHVGKTDANYQTILLRILQKKKAASAAAAAASVTYCECHGYGNNNNNNVADMESLKTIFKYSPVCKLVNEDATLSSSFSSMSTLSSSSSQDVESRPAFVTHLEHMHPYDILTIHPVEFARQATLMEHQLFSAIRPIELANGGWNKPEHKYRLSPNVTNLINFGNKFIYWYAKCIVETLNFEERVAVVQRILDIA